MNCQFCYTGRLGLMANLQTAQVGPERSVRQGRGTSLSLVFHQWHALSASQPHFGSLRFVVLHAG